MPPAHSNYVEVSVFIYVCWSVKSICDSFYVKKWGIESIVSPSSWKAVIKSLLVLSYAIYRDNEQYCVQF